jgi:hypothetical protein
MSHRSFGPVEIFTELRCSVSLRKQCYKKIGHCKISPFNLSTTVALNWDWGIELNDFQLGFWQSFKLSRFRASGGL